MTQELKVIADFYEFMLWLLRHTEKFPRHHRHSLGVSIENRIQAILGLLIKAKYRPGQPRRECLESANIELEVLRFQLRLSKDLRLIPLGSHEHAAGALGSLGSQVGGWLKSAGRP